MTKEQFKEFWRKNKKKMFIIGSSLLFTGLSILLLKKRDNNKTTQLEINCPEGMDVLDFDNMVCVVDNDIGINVFRGIEKSQLSSGKMVEEIDKSIELDWPGFDVDWKNFDAIIVPKDIIAVKKSSE